jgi:hypothetical protein
MDATPQMPPGLDGIQGGTGQGRRWRKGSEQERCQEQSGALQYGRLRRSLGIRERADWPRYSVHFKTSTIVTTKAQRTRRRFQSSVQAQDHGG